MAAPRALTPSSDAAYLRRLLEQPACLIRVRLDGVLLACNDAAFSLFGVGAGRAVLNTYRRDQSQTHRPEHSIESAEIDCEANEERQRAARGRVEEAIAERLGSLC
jgi:hypothetical protein